MANWHYEQNRQSAGPVSDDELRRLVAVGTVTPTTHIWAEGMGNWQPAGTVLPALFAVPPSLPTYAVPTPAAYVSPMSGAYGRSVMIEDQMVKAILVTLFCCMPFGIVAIIKASEANNKAAMGDEMGAHAANAEASKWIKYSIISTLVIVGLYILFYILMFTAVILSGN